MQPLSVVSRTHYHEPIKHTVVYSPISFCSLFFFLIKFLHHGNLVEVDTRRDKVHLSAELRQTLTSSCSFFFFISVSPHFATAPHLFFFISAYSLHTPSRSLSVLLSPTCLFMRFSHINSFWWRLTALRPNIGLLHIFHPHSIFPLFILPAVSAGHSTQQCTFIALCILIVLRVNLSSFAYTHPCLLPQTTQTPIT